MDDRRLRGAAAGGATTAAGCYQRDRRLFRERGRGRRVDRRPLRAPTRQLGANQNPVLVMERVGRNSRRACRYPEALYPSARKPRISPTAQAQRPRDRRTEYQAVTHVTLASIIDVYARAR